ncbi:hypothetical protein MST22_18575 [Virgibacillus halodenitrificans]|uniref:hypothetical protein n=1 Tax=Virgibacillus halodenitrificans TaxID=1482 RepID=UPI001FB36885|nr:hypothetical protein [Virgibacillus halodenitrificans]MCJ0933162.1 hypothetical protein [Virgibacillus halodenitrificans]
MSIENAWVFTETNFKAEKFLNNTGNVYKFVSQKPYVNKKDSNEKGVTLSLSIVKDDTDYGSDKNTGLPRENNILNSFTVTIMNNKDRIDAQKGDYLRLVDFIPDKSFVFGFDLILRFKDVEKVKVKTK